MPIHPPAVSSWLKISVIADQAIADPIAAFLSERIGGTEQITEGNQERVLCYLQNTPESLEEIRIIEDFLQQIGSLTQEHAKAQLTYEAIAEEDWNKTWKEGFKPFFITAHLVIKPSWEDYLATADEKIIEIDPGMAFGTGHHASTRLALELIESLFFEKITPPVSVLDVGTGTGILAMAASLFGAKEVTAIDNDPEAVTVARENLKRNRLDGLITVGETPLEAIPASFDLVIANIIHDTLIELASALTARLNKGGRLILAGILTGQQAASITAAYTGLGLTLQESKSAGEWTALLLNRP